MIYLKFYTNHGYMLHFGLIFSGGQRFVKDVEYMLGKKPQPIYYWLFCWTICAPMLIGVSIYIQLSPLLLQQHHLGSVQDHKTFCNDVLSSIGKNGYRHMSQDALHLEYTPSQSSY